MHSRGPSYTRIYLDLLMTTVSGVDFLRLLYSRAGAMEEVFHLRGRRLNGLLLLLLLSLLSLYP